MNWRRWVVVGLLAFVAAVVVFGFLTTHWKGSLATPAGAKAQSVVFKCPSAFGSGAPKGPNTTAFPVVGKPCAYRNTDRTAAAIDIGFGVVTALGLLTYDRRRPHEHVAI